MAVNFPERKMTLAEAKAIVDQIKYKEGWKIELDRYTIENDGYLFDEYLHFKFSMPVKDVRTGTPILVYVDLDLHFEIDEENLVKRIFDQFVMLERHEASEQFTYKGYAVFNEHKHDLDLEKK